MADILIGAVYPVSGTTIPTNSVDSDGNGYMAWELSDAVSFSCNVPTDYETGTSLVVNLQETSPSTSKNHKWSITTILNGDESSTVTSQITCSATSYTVTSTSITIAALGVIGSDSCAPGDLLSIALSRVAASSNEDSANIRLYSITLTYTVGATVVSGTNRLTTIVSQVLSKFNDDSQGALSSTKILTWINECQQEISSYGYWKMAASINIVGAQESYSLLSLFATLNAVESVIWEDTDKKLVSISTYDLYNQIKHTYASGTIPYVFYLESNTLYLLPVPSASVASGLRIFYSY
jgi:hypothetical protein